MSTADSRFPGAACNPSGLILGFVSMGLTIETGSEETVLIPEPQRPSPVPEPAPEPAEVPA